jgi:hypothetical protein
MRTSNVACNKNSFEVTEIICFKFLFYILVNLIKSTNEVYIKCEFLLVVTYRLVQDLVPDSWCHW